MAEGIVCPGEYSKARIFPVDIKDVKLEGFLGKRMRINRCTSIPAQYEHFLRPEDGTIDNFRIASGEKRGNIITNRLATDSDLYKWMEAVSYDLQNEYDIKREILLEKIISLIAGTQESSGYVDTRYKGPCRKRRFKSLASSHELYCGGHLIQAAIAHYRATGKDNFLNIANRWADFICRKFGKGKIEENDGHPEVEMALVELYRVTGKKKYLVLAEFLMSVPYRVLGGYSFLKFPGVTGHAVRMMYLCSGAADYYTETGDSKYFKKLLSLWKEMIESKVYITGGIGSRYAGEAFGLPYELPNLRAYAESCAAISLMMWNYRMFLLTGETRFMDLFENTLYNGFLSSVSLNGGKYFYMNPLASQGEHGRKDWYNCTCCPTNIQRTIASLPGYFYGVSRDGLWVNLYGESHSIIRLFSGNKIKVLQKTSYPWNGKISIEIIPEKREEFSIFLRIPEWAEKSVLKIKGKKIFSDSGRYVELNDTWGTEKSRVDMNFELNPVLYEAHPEVESTKCSAAIKRGPVLYCLESVDNPDINLFNCRLADTGLKDRFENGLLDGLCTISGELFSGEPSDHPLYGIKDRCPEIKYRRKSFKAIPYFAWANRGKSRMAVWIGR